MLRTFSFIFIVLFVGVIWADESNLADHLQDISVTVKASRSTGSGVIVTRQIKSDAESDTKETVNFVWTAGHVIDDLRHVRTVIDPDGKDKKIVEFRDARIVKELVEKGRKVGQLEMDAKVLKYSDADDGEDLALLMIRKRNFVSASAKFYLKDELIPIGAELFHVGSLLGQSGANSMTSGIMSQVGRVLNLGTGDGVVFDQSTVTAFPGSSGGGVFLATGEDKGKYIGMLVRGAGENFNLIVPIRRMKAWAKMEKVEWAIDTSVKSPYITDILKMKVEDPTTKAMRYNASDEINKKFPFLIDTQVPTLAEESVLK